MRIHSVLIFLGLWLSISTITASEPLSVSILYDNYQLNQELKTDWGFACLVEADGQKLLFDAGRNSQLYQKNLDILGIKAEEIPTLFISHDHGDHTAGVQWLNEINPSVKCYFPSSYVTQLKSRGKLPGNYFVLTEAEHMYGPYYSTGDNFPDFKEQGLVVKTDKGGVLITGCGHPGPVAMVKAAEEAFNIEIYALIGGLHLMNKSEAQLEELASTLKELGLEQICPTHCTGDHSIKFLAESFGDGYISGGTGKTILLQ